MTVVICYTFVKVHQLVNCIVYKLYPVFKKIFFQEGLLFLPSLTKNYVINLKFLYYLDFPGSWDSREFACNAGDLGLIPGSRRFPGKGNGNPLQYLCLGNSMDRGAWRAAVRGLTEWAQLTNKNTHAQRCLGGLLRAPWTARRSSQLILRETNTADLEGLIIKLKLQYFGHLMWTADSLEKSPMLGKIEGRRQRGCQRMRQQDGITNAMDMNLGKRRGTERPRVLHSIG